jgi:predicted transcriptional regulator
MKQLVVSFKSSSEVLDDFRKAYKSARKGTLKATHTEVSFDKRKDFEKFARHIYILSHILSFKPKSVYELAKILKMDVSNLNKIILFFEEFGALRIDRKVINNRELSMPVVDYDEIIIDLKAA